MVVIIGIMVMIAGYSGIPWIASLCGMSWDSFLVCVLFGLPVGFVIFILVVYIVMGIWSFFRDTDCMGDFQMAILLIICELCGIYLMISAWPC